MAPYFDAQSGAMNHEASDDVLIEGREPEEDAEARQARELREQIGMGRTTPPASPPNPPTPTMSPEAAKARYEAIRAASVDDPHHPLRDERSPGHEAAVEEWLRVQELMDGRDPDDPEQNTVVGTLHEGGRILTPAETPAVRVPALTSEAREAGYGWHGPTVEAIIAATDASGLPRYHLEGALAGVAEAAGEIADGTADNTTDAGMAELERVEGRASARQMVTDAQDLVDRLAESGQPALVRAAEALIAVSNHPAAVKAAATLARELRNLTPTGPWEQLLLGAGERYGREQAAAKQRAMRIQQADQAPDDHVVSSGGRR